VQMRETSLFLDDRRVVNYLGKEGEMVWVLVMRCFNNFGLFDCPCLAPAQPVSWHYFRVQLALLAHV
jgi:hypothetical protein